MAPLFRTPVAVLVFFVASVSSVLGDYPAYPSSYYRSPYTTHYSAPANYLGGSGYLSGYPYSTYSSSYNGLYNSPGRYNNYNRWNPSYQLGGYNNLGFGGYNNNLGLGGYNNLGFGGLSAFQQSYGAPYISGNVGSGYRYKK